MRRVTRGAAGDEHADTNDGRRFAIAVVCFAVLFAVVGRLFGQDVAFQLQQTPTTALGWRLVGWLIAGPPTIVAIIIWHERHRLSPRQRRRRGLLLAAWIGLSMFVLPARILGVDNQFGTGALAGDPLSAGWAWGAAAAVTGLAFSALVMFVLRRSVDEPTRGQRDLTVGFLERAWLVLLLVSLGFALYGGRTGVFHGGT